jgi:hypothetical protein
MWGSSKLQFGLVLGGKNYARFPWCVPKTCLVPSQSWLLGSISCFVLGIELSRVMGNQYIIFNLWFLHKPMLHPKGPSMKAWWYYEFWLRLGIFSWPGIQDMFNKLGTSYKGCYATMSKPPPSSRRSFCWSPMPPCWKHHVDLSPKEYKNSLVGYLS